MSGSARIGLFAAAIAALFGGAFALGKAVKSDEGEDSAGSGPLRLALETDRIEPGQETRFAFRVVDGDDEPVSSFGVEHERKMHFIAVRHDLTGYQHLHPAQTADGGWEVPWTVEEPGEYRIFADFEHDSRPYTLHADITAAGDYRPAPLPAAAPTASAGNGYEVELSESGEGVAFGVNRDGRPVDDIEPYLGARGHLVVLRDGDLRYLHVHPEDEATEGRRIRFAVAYPSEGRYRLFLQFKHRGRVHTAAFTQRAGAQGRQSGTAEEKGHGDSHAH